MEQFGKKYEKEWQDCFSRYQKKHLPGFESRFHSTIGTKADLEEGTDFVDFDIRIDFTSRMSKDHVLFRQGSGIFLDGAELEFGLRIGNNHGVKFEQPVLVMGVNLFAEILGPQMDRFMQSVEDRMTDILDAAEEYYYRITESPEWEAAMS